MKTLDIINFKKAMDDIIDTEELFEAMFGIYLYTNNQAHYITEIPMLADFWEMFENVVRDCADLQCEYADTDDRTELSKAFNLKHTEIETTRGEAEDINYIWEITYIGDEKISEELKGFYYGEPSDECNDMYNGKLKAEF